MDQASLFKSCVCHSDLLSYLMRLGARSFAFLRVLMEGRAAVNQVWTGWRLLQCLNTRIPKCLQQTARPLKLRHFWRRNQLLYATQMWLVRTDIWHVLGAFSSALGSLVVKGEGKSVHLTCACGRWAWFGSTKNSLTLMCNSQALRLAIFPYHFFFSPGQAGAFRMIRSLQYSIPEHHCSSTE